MLKNTLLKFGKTPKLWYNYYRRKNNFPIFFKVKCKGLHGIKGEKTNRG